MTITWYGQSCFKITNQGNHLTIITDPFDKKFVGLNPPRSAADIVTVSHDHKDHDNVKAITGDPFVINSPGEYEIKGARITGCASYHDKKQGQERGSNIIYLIKVDRIRVCHLGDFGQERLTDSQLEAIGPVDVLMIPVDGVYTINAREAVKITEQIEPTIIIPMHYEKNKLDKFLKYVGINKYRQDASQSVLGQFIPFFYSLFLMRNIVTF